MRIAIGADWVGFGHKQALIEFLRELDHEPIDMGGHSTQMNDYPDFAEKVGQAITRGEAELGILICGTGIGMSIAANKIPGVRAALCHDAFTTSRSRMHNDANVLVLGALVVSIPNAKELLGLWLTGKYDGGRHEPRLTKIRYLDEIRFQRRDE